MGEPGGGYGKTDIVLVYAGISCRLVCHPNRDCGRRIGGGEGVGGGGEGGCGWEVAILNPLWKVNAML